MLPPKTYNENMSLENDSSSGNHAEDVGDLGGNEINQYDDGNQQSLTANLFDNNETGGQTVLTKLRKVRKCQGN